MGGRPPVGARREQIVEAAADLFSVKGYHGTSMQDIADRVGLLKGSLYAHVAGKEEVLLEIVSTAARRFMAAVEPVARGAAPAPERLRRALRAHLRVIAEHRGIATVYLHEWRHLEGQPARWVREEQARYEMLWQRIFQQAVANGEFRADLDPRIATLLALSAANWGYQWFEAGSDTEEIADQFCDVLLAGCIRAVTPAS
jgi:AcrR family transcriptional regulator